MNWVKFNKVFEIIGGTTFVLLAIASITQLIDTQTFLWGAVAMLLVGTLVSRQVQGTLTKRIQELEGGVKD